MSSLFTPQTRTFKFILKNLLKKQNKETSQHALFETYKFKETHLYNMKRYSPPDI